MPALTGWRDPSLAKLLISADICTLWARPLSYLCQAKDSSALLSSLMRLFRTSRACNSRVIKDVTVFRWCLWKLWNTSLLSSSRRMAHASLISLSLPGCRSWTHCAIEEHQCIWLCVEKKSKDVSAWAYLCSISIHHYKQCIASLDIYIRVHRSDPLQFFIRNCSEYYASSQPTLTAISTAWARWFWMKHEEGSISNDFMASSTQLKHITKPTSIQRERSFVCNRSKIENRFKNAQKLTSHWSWHEQHPL